MRARLLIGFMLLGGLLLWRAVDQSRPLLTPAAAQGEPATGFALVELYTSEGCSSCPPADQLLGELVSEAREKQRQVYALAFHIDYWDNLGWKDPFGQRAFSVRQRRQNQALKTGRVYTPQMIVNGRREFVGSSRREAREAIEEALGQPSALSLTASATREDDVLSVSYQAEPAREEAWLCAALARRQASTDVPSGENGGRTLKHTNVVLAFTRQQLSEEGAGELKLTAPEGLADADADLIVWVEDAEMHTLGASRVALPE